jgi:hypothetical protein
VKNERNIGKYIRKNPYGNAKGSDFEDAEETGTALLWAAGSMREDPGVVSFGSFAFGGFKNTTVSPIETSGMTRLRCEGSGMRLAVVC